MELDVSHTLATTAAPDDPAPEHLPMPGRLQFHQSFPPPSWGAFHPFFHCKQGKVDLNSLVSLPTLSHAQTTSTSTTTSPVTLTDSSATNERSSTALPSTFHLLSQLSEKRDVGLPLA